MTVTTKGWVQVADGSWLRADDVRRVEVTQEASGGHQQVTLTCKGRAQGVVYLAGTSLERGREVRDRIVTQLQCDHIALVVGGEGTCLDCGALDPHDA